MPRALVVVGLVFSGLLAGCVPASSPPTAAAEPTFTATGTTNLRDVGFVSVKAAGYSTTASAYVYQCAADTTGDGSVAVLSHLCGTPFVATTDGFHGSFQLQLPVYTHLRAPGGGRLQCGECIVKARLPIDNGSSAPTYRVIDVPLHFATLSPLDARTSGDVAGPAPWLNGDGCTTAHQTMALTVSPERGGTKHVALDLCWTEQPRTGIDATGHFTYRYGTAQLGGTVRGFLDSEFLVTYHLTVTSGTGSWCNVRGNLDLNVLPNVFSRYQRTAGTVSASLHRDFSVNCPAK
jgi:hypothetical protein